MIVKATVDLFLDVDDEIDACDGVAEMLRDHIRRYAPESCLVDWSYNPGHSFPVAATEAEINELEADTLPCSLAARKLAEGPPDGDPGWKWDAPAQEWRLNDTGEGFEALG